MKGRPPFFVVGCVRSGTSFLRDVLRRHPEFACPEETHFYRGGDPYGVAAQQKSLAGNVVLKKHRELDGVSEAEFRRLLGASRSRADLTQRYMRLYSQRRRPQATRWFDKTPQNVYGAALIAAQFRRAKFVHIVRDPRAVAASLRVGRVVQVPELIGACNYWTEAIQIMDTVKRAYRKRVHELRHEDLLDDLEGELKKLFEFLEEPFEPSHFADVAVRHRIYAYEELFSMEELDTIREQCGELAGRYGYDLE